MGTPDFGAIVLKKLLQKSYQPILAVTAPDKPVGRKKIIIPPPVKIIAENSGIPVVQPFKLSEIKDKIKELGPDLIIVAAYGYYVPKEIFEIPSCKTINVHPSLLPEYRGPSPIQTVILEGRNITGATIIKIDEEIDHGPIIAQKKFSVPEKICYKDLENQLADLGANLLIKILPDWLDKKIKPKPQDDLTASFTKIIKKEDGKINWQELNCVEIERKIRAFQPWPSTYTFWEKNGQKNMLKILEAEAIESIEEESPGKVFSTEKDKIIVQCQSGALAIKKLQLEGKNIMTSVEFILGNKKFIGSILK